MKAPVAALKAARESRPGGRINLQESQSTTAATRQIRLLHASKNLQQVRGLGVLHGRLSQLVCVAQDFARRVEPLVFGVEADGRRRELGDRRLGVDVLLNRRGAY